MNTLDMFAPTAPLLTVYSVGAGQESSAVIEMHLDDEPGFKQKYATRDVLAVMADTGDEYEETYEQVKYLQRRCEERGMEFAFITPSMGFHAKGWQSLRQFYRTHDTIGSKSYNKTCSDQLKIQPIYRFLEHWLSKRYGVSCHEKKGIREFAAIHGKIQMVIGLAKGEENRISDPKDSKKVWYRDSVQTIYPLIELGMDRKACQDYLHAKGLRVVPSNCKACPFLSLEELEYLRRFLPADLDDWIILEAAKLKKYKHLEAVIVTDKHGQPLLDKHGNPKIANKNFGVFGVKPLPIKISEATEKFKDWSDDRIKEYRYSHGKCITNKW